MITTIFKTAGDARDITIKRPDYRSYAKIAIKVAALLEVEPEAATSAPEFEQVLQACTVENIDGWLGEADYQEVIRLWDAVIEHCEFESFFAERHARHFESSKGRMEHEFEISKAKTEREVELQAAQISRLKSTGQLPESWSLADALSAGLNLEGILTSSPSSRTTTPTSTDGSEETSSGKTSGSSSATSRKPRGAAKHSSN